MAQPPYARHGTGAVKSCAYVCSRNSLAALNTLYIVSKRVYFGYILTLSVVRRFVVQKHRFFIEVNDHYLIGHGCEVCFYDNTMRSNIGNSN